MDCENVEESKSITTAQDTREITQLIMKPYANWEEYLTPAPLSIAILGELAFISSKTDFSINQNPPKGGYKYIRYPESFRACLMQVCNSGWGAFNEAHKSMDQIRLHTSTVPDYIKSAVKILFQGSDEVIQALLPNQLNTIKEIANKCKVLSESARKRFDNVFNVICELLEVCCAEKHTYEKKKEEIKNKLAEAEKRKEYMGELDKKLEKAKKILEKELTDSKKIYEKAMDSLPAEDGSLIMALCESIVDGMTSVVSGLMSIVAKGLVPDNISTTVYNHVKHVHEPTTVDMVDSIYIYSKSATLLQIAENLKTYVKKQDTDCKSFHDQRSCSTWTDFQKDELSRVKDFLETYPDCKPRNSALRICNTGINICEQFEKYASEGECNNDETKKIVYSIEKLIKLARIFDSESKSATNTPSMAQKPPMMSSREKRKRGFGAWFRGSNTESAHFCAQQAYAELNKARDSYANCVQKTDDNQKEIMETLIAMRSYNLQEIDFTKTIDVLIEGMDAMGKVKMQWEKMTMFFQMVSDSLGDQMCFKLLKFAENSKATATLSYSDKLFSKDLLYNQAFQASNIASLVHMISDTYTNVSSMHLMNQVGALGRLLTMDMRKEKEFEHELKALRDSCDKAVEDIRHQVQKSKADFENIISARIKKIKETALPPLPAEQAKAIKETVQIGFSKADIPLNASADSVQAEMSEDDLKDFF